MPTRADALHASKSELADLQAKMAGLTARMTATIDALLQRVPLKEARQFLRVECGVPTSDLKIYAGLAGLSVDQQNIIEEKAVPFTVVRALVSSDKETVQEAISVLASGSKLDTRQVGQIRRRIRASANPIATLERDRVNLVVKAATRQAKKSVHYFEERVTSLINDAFELVAEFDPFHDARPKRFEQHAALKATAQGLKADFDRLFGAPELSKDELVEMNSADPAYRLCAARHALDLLSGCGFDLFGDGFDPTGTEDELQRHLSPLFAISSITIRHASPQGYMTRKSSPRRVPALVTRAPEPLTVVELCGGAGAMALGFEAAGYEHAAIFEKNGNAVATMRANRPDWHVVHKDIDAIDFRPFRGTDVLTGGLPCQSFSIAGSEKGSEDERNLFTSSLRAIEEIQPRAFVFENVLGFRRGKHSDYRAYLLQRSDELGYRCEIQSIDAQDYGVPQARQRVVVVGIRKTELGVFKMPPRFPQWRLHLGDALRQQMASNGWAGADAWADAIGKRIVLHNEVPVFGAVAPTLTRMKKTPRANQRKAWSQLGVDIRWVPDDAPTNEEAFAAGSAFMPGLTQQMRARIQDFPDGWLFNGPRGSVSQQIANAFPPVMAQAVALAVYSALEGVEFDYEAALRGRLADGVDRMPDAA